MWKFVCVVRSEFVASSLTRARNEPTAGQKKRRNEDKNKACLSAHHSSHSGPPAAVRAQARRTVYATLPTVTLGDLGDFRLVFRS